MSTVLTAFEATGALLAFRLVSLLQSNVLAPYAEAIINHRIHPSQTVSEVQANFSVASFYNYKGLM